MGAAEPSASRSVDATEALAALLARDLRPGDVVHLCGEVGAGKTTFVRGACRALGFTGPVTSPSYTISNRYEDGGVLISHLDCQRLEGLSGEEAGLLDDEIGPDRITFIEWPQQSIGAVGTIATIPAAVRVELAHVSPQERIVMIERTLR